jgi:hypothetical protein
MLEELEEFISRYHARPSPERVCRYLDQALTKENLEDPVVTGSPNTLNLFAHAFGHMAKGNANLVRQFEGRFADATDAGRSLLIECLRVCGDAETVKHLAAWQEDPRFADHKESLEAARAFLADPQRKLPRDLPAKTPEELDLLWSDFLVTGEYAPVARILDVFDETKKQPAVLQEVAAWSMRSNLEQHPRLAELLRANQKDRPEPSRRLIQQWLAMRSCYRCGEPSVGLCRACNRGFCARHGSTGQRMCRKDQIVMWTVAAIFTPIFLAIILKFMGIW